MKGSEAIGNSSRVGETGLNRRRDGNERWSAEFMIGPVGGFMSGEIIGRDNQEENYGQRRIPKWSLHGQENRIVVRHAARSI